MAYEVLAHPFILTATLWDRLGREGLSSLSSLSELHCWVGIWTWLSLILVWHSNHYPTLALISMAGTSQLHHRKQQLINCRRKLQVGRTWLAELKCRQVLMTSEPPLQRNLGFLPKEPQYNYFLSYGFILSALWKPTWHTKPVNRKGCQISKRSVSYSHGMPGLIHVGFVAWSHPVHSHEAISKQENLRQETAFIQNGTNVCQIFWQRHHDITSGKDKIRAKTCWC